ncbi:DUF3800 domain-containing protein [Methanobrevibacter filiformis]|uniref:DUF3800 domain-containing protein n=1 Tax=Methanobrevibacter filiformis TaxID=55758 RepID=A0A166FF24_9EURY|nr:DUF3800 domain-containing protein [Methanobrevibacter filiformis]KZX17610.1 hypothetical protein MBFIL_00390 [Methanobrevibacter filiformis]
MEYLFLDESGDMGLNDNNYFIISILRFDSHDECCKLNKIRNKILKRRFRKEILTHNEIKFNAISHKLKTHALNELNKLDFNSYSIIINKKDHNNLNLFKNNNKNEIYIDIVLELLKKIELNKPFTIRMDKFLPSKYIDKFNHEFLDKFQESKIYHSNSTKYIGIQFVDLISGSSFQYFERNNSEFLDIFENKHSFYYYKKYGI